MTVRTRRAGREGRAGGALAHLLLVVVLALGVFLMHTLGHPEGSGGGAHGGAATAASAATVASTASHGHDGGSTDTGHGPGTGTDTTTLCVAVLGVWLLARLVLAALGRRPGRPVLRAARPVHAPGAHAPPRPPPDPVLLSVLRI